MRYRIVKKGDMYYPQYRGRLRWKPLEDLMGDPAKFGGEHAARLFINRMHCNYLNNTAQRRIKWGRSLEPHIQN